MNFKGVEKFFLKLLFTGQSFKVSFRNVLGLLVVPPTLFQVAFGHRASWALSFLGFGPIQRVHDMSPHEGHRSFWLIRLFRPAFVFFAAMMRTVVLNAALALVAHTPALLQLLTPWDLHQLQAR